nr:solute carrier family 22 member 13-like [Parasteatoda tepidariorum]
MFQGVLIGTPLFSALSWRYGRRVTFLASVALVAASDVGSTLVPVFFLCILLRIVEGMALATVYTSGYFIIMELVHPKLRVRVNEISTKCWCAGSCLVPFLAYATRSWVYLTSISSCSALLIFIIAFWILPESPSWLITRGRYKDVVDILHSMNKLNGLKIQNMTLLLYKVQNDELRHFHNQHR